MRIYVPFLAWSGIYLAFKGGKALLLPGQPNDFPGVDLLWLGSFYHLWFMPFVLLVTLAVFCLARIAAGDRAREFGLLFVALIAGVATCLAAGRSVRVGRRFWAIGSRCSAIGLLGDRAGDCLSIGWA